MEKELLLKVESGQSKRIAEVICKEIKDSLGGPL